ncbi:TNF receptor-associated factor 4-like isoform X2 [Clytia hemisphaerica]|uniref:TNF receptor-associated factor 4-like isoform X2 n=1 Tax=Clytia hemisphaerica TaxID=252671 RepID=UPI0034D52A94
MPPQTTANTKGGYEVDFVKDYDEMDDVTCSICLFVLREPMQSESCGHRFCKSCVKALKKNNNDEYTCPKDRRSMKLFNDKGKEREILSRMVKCRNHKDGCEIHQELRNLQNHLSTCEFQEVPCRVEECKEKFQRRFLVEHNTEACQYRLKSCPFCFEDYAFYTEKMKFHISDECVKVPKPCEFVLLGCQKQTTIDNSLKHNNDATQYHLSLALNKITEQQNEIIALKSNQEKMAVNPCYSLFKDEHIIQIDDFQRKFREAVSGVPIKRYFFTSRLQKMTMFIFLKGHNQKSADHLSIFFNCAYGSYDDLVDWPMNATLYWCILYEDELRKCKRTVTKDGYEKTGAFRKPEMNKKQGDWGIPKYVSWTEVSNLVENNVLRLQVNIEHH